MTYELLTVPFPAVQETINSMVAKGWRVHTMHYEDAFREMVLLFESTVLRPRKHDGMAAKLAGHFPSVAGNALSCSCGLHERFDPTKHDSTDGNWTTQAWADHVAEGL